MSGLLDAAKSRPVEGGPSYPLSHRLFRLAWSLAWLALARFTPPQLHGWRRWVLRAFGAKVGPGVRVHGSAWVWHPGNLELGEGVLIGPGARLYNQGHIAIGAWTVVSHRAHLCAGSHAINDSHFPIILRPIVVGERCWIAIEGFVGPSVTMGDGAVLAARGALFENAEADGVYRGNPAALISRRRVRHGPR